MRIDARALALGLLLGCAARGNGAAAARDGAAVWGEPEDRDHDGRPERWIERDARGRPWKISRDDNHDGRRDRVEIYVDGRLNRVDYDSDSDGALDATDQVGADGTINLTLWDRDWNTVPERWVQKNRRGQVTGEWTDRDQDSVPERFRAFDPSGRVTEEGTDRDGDGLFEVNTVYNTRWSPNDHALRVERDDDRDGIYERRETFTREGTLRSVNEDTDRDGNRDHLVLFLADGQVRKEGFDRDGDGWFEEWRFPVPGGGTRVAHDDDADYDLDRWEPPGPPVGWCSARCATPPVARQPSP